MSAPDVARPATDVRTLDLRLVPAALAAWVTALVVVRVPVPLAGVGTSLAVLTGVAAVLAAAVVLPLTGARRTWAGAARTSRRAVAGLVLAAVAAVGAAGAAQVEARAHGLLPRLVAASDAGTIVGRVVGEPVPVRAAWPGAPPRVRWVLAADRVTARVAGAERSSRAVGTVVVLAPAEPRTRTATRTDPVTYGALVEVAGSFRPTGRGARDVALLVASGDVTLVRGARPWDTLATRVRDGVRRLAGTLPGDAGALLPGVTVGDTSAVPDDLADAMRAAGLTHLVAVSGAHFALVVALVVAAGAGVGASGRVQAAVAGLVTAALVVLVHPEPSVVRAAVMGGVGLLGLARGRPARAPAALGAAVVVLLVADPWLAGELGFALSVAATGGIVLLGTPLARRWAPRLGRAPAATLAAPVAAALVCAPLVLVVSGVVTPWGVLANLVAAPAVAPATLLGLLAALLAPWWPAAAAPVAWLAGAACWWLGAVARGAAALPGASVPWLPGPAGVLLLAVLGVAVARLLLGPRRVSAGSGRLGACLPLPDRPAVRRVVRPDAARAAAARPGPG